MITDRKTDAAFKPLVQAVFTPELVAALVKKQNDRCTLPPLSPACQRIAQERRERENNNHPCSYLNHRAGITP